MPRSMNASATPADAASQPPKQHSEAPSEQLEPLTTVEILEAYDRLAGPLASSYCGS